MSSTYTISLTIESDIDDPSSVLDAIQECKDDIADRCEVIGGAEAVEQALCVEEPDDDDSDDDADDSPVVDEGWLALAGLTPKDGPVGGFDPAIHDSDEDCEVTKRMLADKPERRKVPRAPQTGVGVVIDPEQAPFVVYHYETTIIPRLKRKGGDESYATRGAARAALNRAAKAGRLGDVATVEEFEISSKTHFHANIEKWTTVNNLMSGKPVRQRVNTPLSCDVSSETYWSM